jgi:hypothetical protein
MVGLMKRTFVVNVSNQLVTVILTVRPQRLQGVDFITLSQVRYLLTTRLTVLSRHISRSNHSVPNGSMLETRIGQSTLKHLFLDYAKSILLFFKIILWNEYVVENRTKAMPVVLNYLVICRNSHFNIITRGKKS